MKSYLTVVLVYALFVSPNMVTAQTPKMASNNMRVIEAWFEALQDHDLDRWVALHSDSVVWNFPQNGGRLEGRAELRRAIDGFIAKYPDIRFEKTQMFGTKEKIALEWREWGTENKTGKSVEYYFCGILTIKDGNVTEVQRYGGKRKSEE